jgi:gag-polypeptide of LTR copia-type
MRAKELWKHVEGTATAPVLYAVSNSIPMLANEKMPATEDQIKEKESKIIKFEKREYLACHILMSITLMHLRTRIKGLATPEDMWKAIKEDATSKSTLFLIDAKDQLSSIKLIDNDDPKTHLAELKQHSQLMLQHHESLMKIGSVMSDSWFNTIIMSSLSESY